MKRSMFVSAGVLALLASGTAYAVFDACDAFGLLEGSIPPAGADLKFAPAVTDDYVGRSIALGDFNGDDVDDIAIGANGVDDNGGNSGAVYVFFGPVTTTTALAPVDADARLYGERLEDKTGWALANAGDVDGDGTDDLLIGALPAGGASGGAGIAHIVRGSAGLTGDIDLATYTDATRIFGQSRGDEFGSVVAGIGDIDADGFADFAVGAPKRASPGGAVGAGAVYVIQGSGISFGNAPPIYVGVSGRDVMYHGDVANGRFGSAIAGVGRLGGGADLFDDFIVGAPFDSTGGSEAGAAFVFHGRGGGYATTGAAAADRRLYGTGIDRVGASLAYAGDIDNDGRGDFWIGAPQSGYLRRGGAYLVRGADPTTLGGVSSAAVSAIQGVDQNDLFGTAIVGDIDVNGDGLDDAIITGERADGLGQYTGGAVVLYGPLVNIVGTVAGLEGAVFPGESYLEFWGSAAAGGDLNADDFDDVFIGGWRSSRHRLRSGAVGGFLGGADTADEQAWYADADADNFGDSSVSVVACEQPEINGVLYVDNDQDCDDASVTTFPGAPESCSEFPAVDRNCDGRAGAGPSNDGDGDGFAACEDCNDTNPLIKPLQGERCGDGIDNDCDGDVDDASSIDAVVYFPDVDNDGFGDRTQPIPSCTVPTLASAVVTRGLDCNDNAFTVNPAAAEVCSDSLDNDCDDVINGSNAVDAIIWWRDGDADAYGDEDVYTRSCTQPSGFVANRLDCDDGSATTKPGASEVCDYVDNNCDGMHYIGGPGQFEAYNLFLGAVGGASDAAGDQLGLVMSFIPDWDGDGDDELAMAAIGVDNTNAPDAGAVYIRRGSEDRRPQFDMATSYADGTADWNVRFISTRKNSRFGGSIAAGDFDGNGITDVAIGAPGAPVPEGNRGAVYVFFNGRANGSYTSESADLILRGEAANNEFGSALTVGDFNGDGRDDLAASAYKFTGTQVQQGKTYVMYGTTFGTLTGTRLVAATADATFLSPGVGDLGGYSLSSGDINDDGKDELFVGAPFYGNLDTGRVYVVYGAAAQWTGALVATSIISGPTTDGVKRWGTSVAGLGDVNDDGFNDLAIGSVGAGAWLILGQAAQLPNADGNTLARIAFYGGAFQGVGAQVRALGDLNDDSYADFGIAAPDDDQLAQDAGAFFVIYGASDTTLVDVIPPAGNRRYLIDNVESFGRLPASGTFPTYSAINTNVLHGAKMLGWGTRQSYGFGVAGDGDFDGDTVPDLAVAAHLYDRSGTVFGNGRVGLYLGGAYGHDVGSTVLPTQTVYYWDWDADGFADDGPPPPTFAACPMHVPISFRIPSAPRARGIPTIPAPDPDLITDCNDRDYRVNPDAAETQGDGQDMDCDGYDNPNVIPVVTVEIEPANPLSTDTLVADVSVYNPDDGQSLVTVFYQWYKRSVSTDPWTPIFGATTATLLPTNFSKGDFVRVGVYADDTRDVSPTVYDEVAIANTPPVISSCAIAPSAGGVTTPFSVAAGGLFDDDPGDAGSLTVNYQWEVYYGGNLWVPIPTNVPGATNPNRGSCFASNQPSGSGNEAFNCYRGSSIRASCTPRDASTSGTKLWSNVVTIANTLPVVTSCTINSTNGMFDTLDTLRASGFGTDADIETVVINYEWVVTTYDGRAVTMPMGNEYPPSLTEHFDQVAVRCTPQDQNLPPGFGTPVLSTPVVIANTRPTAPDINLTPDLPLSNQDLLTTIIQPATDIDGDTLTYRYYWTRNSVPFNNPTYPSSLNTVSKVFTIRGETWSVTVMAFDGYVEGLSDTDSEVIRNTPPTFTGANITPAAPDTRDTLTANGTGWYDDDGDIPLYRVLWYRNGTPLNGPTGITLSPETQVPPVHTTRGDNFYAVVQGFDGIDYSASTVTTATTTIVNAPPEPGTLAIYSKRQSDQALVPVTEDPYGPGTTEMFCTRPTESTDADGDALTYTVTWVWVSNFEANGDETDSSGNPISSWPHVYKSTSGVLTNHATAWNHAPTTGNEFGDRWYCTVTPNDGFVNGATAVSPEIVIQDGNAPAAPVINVIPAYINEGFVRLSGSCQSVPRECLSLYFQCTDNLGGDSGQVLGDCASTENFTQDITVNRGATTSCRAWCVDQGNSASLDSNTVVTSSCNNFDTYELTNATYGDSSGNPVIGTDGSTPWATFQDVNPRASTALTITGNTATSIVNGVDTYDWYRFTALDNLTSDVANSVNRFRFRLRLTAGASDYSYVVYRTTNTAATTPPVSYECSGHTSYHAYDFFNWDTGGGTTAGASRTIPVDPQLCFDPAASSSPPSGQPNGSQAPTTNERFYNDCASYASRYWVRVQRDSALSCQHYTLAVSLSDASSVATLSGAD